jgi:hypothetical protein
MAGTVGGSLDSISIDGRIFNATADADVSMDLGGFSSEQKPLGNGDAIDVMTRKIWKATGIKVGINHDQADQQFLQAAANDKTNKPITITLASGHTYQARGKPTGDLNFSTMDSVCELELSGPGALEVQ